MDVKSIRDVKISGKRVFVRVDFNVPLDDGGEVRDDSRIRRAIPTIEYAIEQGACIILASHLGRPKGERRPDMSLRPVAARLAELLQREVRFAEDCVGANVEEAVGSLEYGDLILLENLRFHKGETENDREFSRELASVAEVYVNDAFGTAHRAHASTVGITEFVTERAAGLLLKEELESLDRAFSRPRNPVVAVFGGAKVSDKLGVLKHLLDRMDSILIGGGMANTFLAARGFNMGASRVEEEMIGVADRILKEANEKSCAVMTPVDLVTAERPASGVRTGTVDVGMVPEGQMALDIGKRTAGLFAKEIAEAGTIVWNGPMGVFEIEEFKQGTLEVARAVADASGFSVIGGGDTVRAVHEFQVAERMSYISTGGGAFMEFLEGKTLPGVAALEQ